MKLAAIDIGSNAARLLITEVVQDGAGQDQFNKLNLVRVPLRLGFDVFESSRISPEKEDHVLKTIKAYRALIDVYGVKHYLACATSAMRDAANGQEIISRIAQETGIEIKIISGDEEASFIYENHIAENLDTDHSYLYIDVGGGSTELTFFSDNTMVFKESFNIGTIRLLKDQVTEEKWDEMKNYIRTRTKGYKEITCIGSGGNINKVFSLSKKKDGKPLPLELLKDYYKELSSFSVADRMRLYSLREDRADVIVPALSIFINVMRWSDAREIYVPKIGLADGLIHILWSRIQSGKSK
ncbi:Ppx/GppA phosphatase family protein [Flavihumibacter petaseus]|uniref:Putative phosphatase n=1 Tax=Flavihumibacter petaseus NBRC 106054 TaxID=1220578 RepID=A0A0E9N3M0_9BACT|nr:exopolyphosphatase [Flavihumibacter petaseus]GAO44409.1 putative phosphatase [Flavihumibacter petaseus NBRC 106054]